MQAGLVYQLAEQPDFGGRPLLGSDQLPDVFHDSAAGAGVEPFHQFVPVLRGQNIPMLVHHLGGFPQRLGDIGAQVAGIGEEHPLPVYVLPGRLPSVESPVVDHLGQFPGDGFIPRVGGHQRGQRIRFHNRPVVAVQAGPPVAVDGNEPEPGRVASPLPHPDAEHVPGASETGVGETGAGAVGQRPRFFHFGRGVGGGRPQTPPVFFAGQGRRPSPFFQKIGVFPPQPLNVAEHFRFARSESGQHLPGSHRRIRQSQFAAQPRLQPQQPVQMGGGEKTVDEHPAVRGTDPVDAPVPLHHPHRIPGQVVVDDPPRLLQVHPFRQDVGGEQQVVFIFAPFPPARRFGGEPGDDAGPRFRVESPFGPEHRLGDPLPEVGQRILVGAVHRLLGNLVGHRLNGVGEAGENDGFAPVPRTDPVPADRTGFGGDLPQPFQQLVQFGVGPLRRLLGPLPQPPQHFQVAFHVFAQFFHVIVAGGVRPGGGAVVQPFQKLVEIFRIRGCPFPQGFARQHPAFRQRLQESPMGFDHSPQSVGQSDGG